MNLKKNENGNLHIISTVTRKVLQTFFFQPSILPLHGE